MSNLRRWVSATLWVPIFVLVAVLYIFGWLLMLGIPLSWISLGMIGIQEFIGGWLGVVASIVALVMCLYSLLPMALGVFYCIVWFVGWPWWAGVLIAAPGLVLASPSLLAAAVTLMVGWINHMWVTLRSGGRRWMRTGP